MPRVRLLLALLAGGCAVDVGLQDEALPIVRGDLEDGEPAIVALVSGGATFCSGTLIAPRVVVTAAHCVPPNIALPPEAIEVFFGDVVGVATGERRAVEAIEAHPDWRADAAENDLGLIALTEDAPVAPLPTIPASQPLTIGERVKLVGFGMTASGEGDQGRKRSGIAAIARMTPSTFYLEADPTLTCEGDSGGPLLAARSPEWVLAGVHSRSDCAGEFLDERLDVHLPGRISAFVAEHGGGAPCLVDGVCDDDCAADLDCGPLERSRGRPVEGGCAAGADGGAGAGGPAAVLLGLVAIWYIRNRRTGRS